MRLGDVVHVLTCRKSHDGRGARAYVVVSEPVGGRVKLCYCGSARWFVARWHPVEDVLTKVDENGYVREARRLLALERKRPDRDGWIRIKTGRSPNWVMETVGHVEVSHG